MPTHVWWEPQQIQITTMPHLCGLVHHASRSMLGNSWMDYGRVKGFDLLGPMACTVAVHDGHVSDDALHLVQFHTTNYSGCSSLLFLHPSALADVFRFVIGCTHVIALPIFLIMTVKGYLQCN